MKDVMLEEKRAGNKNKLTIQDKRSFMIPKLAINQVKS